ncbi:MAG: DUF4365 domain-containing protein [Planctomycetota bacterium]
MTPKEINRSAGRIFASLIPASWAIRSQEDQEDYGIDYEMELTDEHDRATGFIFKVQQKGELSLDFDSNGKTVKYHGLKVQRLRYYLNDLKVPVVFAVVGVQAKQAYWTLLQGYSDVEKVLRDAEAAGHQQTVTLRLPVTNLLPATADRLLEEVKRCMDWLFIRSVERMLPLNLLDVAKRHPDPEQLLNAFRLHADVLRCDQIDRLIEAADFSEALKVAKTVFASQSETTRMRFAAGMYVMRIDSELAFSTESGDRHARVLKIRTNVAIELLRLTRTPGTERQLRVYARFLLRSARLRRAAEQVFALTASYLGQQGIDGPMAKLTSELTLIHREAVAAEFAREFARTVSRFDALIEQKAYHLVPQAWITLAQDVLPFLARLHMENSDKQLLLRILGALGGFAQYVCVQLKAWDDLTTCAHLHLFVANPNDAADVHRRVEESSKILDAIPDETARSRAKQELQSLQEQTFQNTGVVSLEDQPRLVEEIVRQMGIDLDNPNDPTGQIVRVGIDDMNPERVLRHCQHRFVQLGASGIPAIMVQLPTAGSKTLHCTKHGNAVGGLSFDGILQVFESQLCSKCNDRTPHPADWRWSPEWQAEQEKQHGPNCQPLC